MLGDLIYSRPLSAAAKLGRLAPDHRRFTDKCVLLTGEENTLATANGRECFLASIRLLVRICSNVSIALPRVDRRFEAECNALIHHVAFGSPIAVFASTLDFGRFDAILSVGVTPRLDLPWTVINSNGWLARVSSGNSPLPGACGQFNPIAALAAASLGVTDVFKRLIQLKEKRGRLHNGLFFSLMTFRCGDNDPGPELPTEIPLDLTQVRTERLETELFISSVAYL